jgi:hypothetical protein
MDQPGILASEIDLDLNAIDKEFPGVR